MIGNVASGFFSLADVLYFALSDRRPIDAPLE